MQVTPDIYKKSIFLSKSGPTCIEIIIDAGKRGCIDLEASQLVFELVFSHVCWTDIYLGAVAPIFFSVSFVTIPNHPQYPAGSKCWEEMSFAFQGFGNRWHTIWQDSKVSLFDSHRIQVIPLAIGPYCKILPDRNGPQLLDRSLTMFPKLSCHPLAS